MAKGAFRLPYIQQNFYFVELYLYLHGGVSCLYFDGSDMNLKELLALKKKKIKKEPIYIMKEEKYEM